MGFLPLSLVESGAKNLNEGKSYWERRREVSLKPLQRLAVSKGRALVARRNERNLLIRRFSFDNFSLCAFRAKEKSGQ